MMASSCSFSSSTIYEIVTNAMGCVGKGQGNTRLNALEKIRRLRFGGFTPMDGRLKLQPYECGNPVKQRDKKCSKIRTEANLTLQRAQGLFGCKEDGRAREGATVDVSLIENRASQNAEARARGWVTSQGSTFVAAARLLGSLDALVNDNTLTALCVGFQLIHKQDKCKAYQTMMGC
jgi:hypothetical protein